MSALRARIRSGERLVGTFVKTPSPHIVELLGLAGLDFVVCDREHAPIDLSTLDAMVGFAGSSGLAVLTRVPAIESVSIAAALDAGSAGVVVPHVRSAREAEAVLEAVKYARGRRSFSPFARAGGYGTCNPQDYRLRADAESVVMAQIEDRDALEALDAMASLDEIDVLFVGPADLALSLGCAPGDPALREAIDAVIAAGRRHAKAVGIFVGVPEQIAPLAAEGITVFICGSDQSLVLSGARRLKEAAGAEVSNARRIP